MMAFMEEDEKLAMELQRRYDVEYLEGKKRIKKDFNLAKKIQEKERMYNLEKDLSFAQELMEKDSMKRLENDLFLANSILENEEQEEKIKKQLLEDEEFAKNLLFQLEFQENDQLDVHSSLPPEPLGEVEVEECTICLESLQNDFHILPCIHKFHQNCINDWLKRSDQCPNCLQKIK